MSTHVIRLSDLPSRTIEDVLELAARQRRRPAHGELTGRTVGLLFFRGSLRTRTSLEVAVHQLGGHTVNLTAMSDFWDLEDRDGAVMDGRAPEHIKDAATVLSSYVDALAIRTAPTGRSWDVDRKDAQIAAWARYSRVPVVNMESALWHPLQSLADLLTLRERLGELAGKKLLLTWVHSPQPATPSVAHSLVHAALAVGMHVRVAHPAGYHLDEGVLNEARGLAEAKGGRLELSSSQDEGADGVHAVYARSWASLEDYGNPTLAASRQARFKDWRVDEALLARGDDAKLLHAMPVRRNVEVSDAILDGERSLVYEQAENRLHTQKALLTLLLSGNA